MDFRLWQCKRKAGGPRPTEVEAAPILPGLWYVGDYQRCCYLLHTEAGPVMIDTGVEQHADHYLAQLQRAGADPADLAALLHTHAHSDHTGATPRLFALSGADIMIGAGDAVWLAQHVPVSRMLCPREEVAFGPTRISFFPTPGHTIGCGMYLTEIADARVCFTGDAAGPYIFSDVRWEGDADAFRASASRMKDVAADLYLPGHPYQTLEVSPDGDPRLSRDQWHRYIDNRLQAMEDIVAGRRP